MVRSHRDKAWDAMLSIFDVERKVPGEARPGFLLPFASEASAPREDPQIAVLGF